MIYKEGKEITKIFKSNKEISYVYPGALLVWQPIRSCFGSGFWVNEKPWLSEEGWRNNKK